jgi:hypothetical protein
VVSHTQSRRRLRSRLLAAAIPLVLAVPLAASPAHAGTTTICSWPTQVSGNGHCPPGARHTLTAVYTHSSYGSCSGAWVSYPSDFYGSYACQGIDSSHPYNAGNLLYGASHSSVSYVNWLSGYETW